MVIIECKLMEVDEHVAGAGAEHRLLTKGSSKVHGPAGQFESAQIRILRLCTITDSHKP